jgi:eukaryotic-like serine/threonine-protein kinase
LLTGSRPYRPKGPTRRDLEQAILDQDPSKPSDQLLTANTGDSESGKSARRMRGDLDTVVLKALRKDPKQRYATAQAFADDLKRYLAFEPIAAKPDAGWYRVGRFVRRNRWGMMAVTSVLIALTAGALSTLWQARRAEAEAVRANAESVRANAEAVEKVAEANRASVAAKEAQQQSERAIAATLRAEKSLAEAQAARQRAVEAAQDSGRSRAASQKAAITAAAERDDAQRQREAAVRQTEIAVKEASRADIVGNFMMDAFVSARPGSAGAPPVTVLKALEDAVERARADVNMPADGRVALLLQMGDLLQAHGKLAESRKLLEENFLDAERRLGLSSLTTLNVGIALGRTLSITGRFAEARILFDKLISSSRAAPVTITAPLYASSGQLASKMQEKERAIREAELGYSLCKTECSSENRIERASEYANVLATFDRAPQALVIYQELDPLIKSRYGARSMRRATLLAATSRAARLSGDISTAVATVRQALEIDDAVLPPTDYRRGRHLLFLALALREQGDFREASIALQQSLTIERAAIGTQHLDLAFTLNTMGGVTLQLNENKNSAEHFESAHRILQATHGDAHRDTLDARASRGYALAMSGDSMLGQSELVAAIGGFERISPLPFDLYFLALERRALLAIDAGDGPAAMTALREIEKRMPSLTTGRSYWAGRLKAELAWASLLSASYADALAYLAEAETELKTPNATQAETVLQIAALRALALKGLGENERALLASGNARASPKKLSSPLTRTIRLLNLLP